MASTIFYSWQSDLPNATNRGFIQKALENAVRSIGEDDTVKVEPVIDRDTASVPGSPDMAATIFEKIDNCDVFVCDVSIVNARSRKRPTPNPNVLIELGYALKRLGWSRIVMVLNLAEAPVEKLPFDLRMKRVVRFQSRSDDSDRAGERRSLTSKLTKVLREIYTHMPADNLGDSDLRPRVELQPDVGPAPERRLQVTNEGNDDSFTSSCEIVSVRNNSNGFRNSSFPLGWAGTREGMVKIRRGQTEALVIGRSESPRDYSEPNRCAEISLFERSADGLQLFDHWRWVVTPDAQLPECTIRVVVRASMKPVPVVQEFVFRPASFSEGTLLEPVHEGFEQAADLASSSSGDPTAGLQAERARICQEILEGYPDDYKGLLRHLLIHEFLDEREKERLGVPRAVADSAIGQARGDGLVTEEIVKGTKFYRIHSAFEGALAQILLPGRSAALS